MLRLRPVLRQTFPTSSPRVLLPSSSFSCSRTSIAGARVIHNTSVQLKEDRTRWLGDLQEGLLETESRSHGIRDAPLRQQQAVSRDSYEPVDETFRGELDIAQLTEENADEFVEADIAEYQNTLTEIEEHGTTHLFNAETAFPTLADDGLLSPPPSSSVDEDSDIQLPELPPPKPKPLPFINLPGPDPLLQHLTSQIMRDGKRSQARKVVSRTLMLIHAYTRAPPLPIFREAIFAITPQVKVLAMKGHTRTTYKPIPLSEKRGTFRAVKALLESVDNRKGGPMLEERIAREIIKIIDGSSRLLTMREEIHKMAMVNRGGVR